jgi:hypothetical protein
MGKQRKGVSCLITAVDYGLFAFFTEATRNVELRSGKPLIDAYSKRSMTLVEKVSSSLRQRKLRLTLNAVGRRLGKIDRRICGNLYNKVGDSHPPLIFFVPAQGHVTQT